MTTGTTVKDPVCNMDVNPDRAKYTHDHLGQRYYFCSPGCEKKFSENPTEYVKRQNADTARSRNDVLQPSAAPRTAEYSHHPTDGRKVAGQGTETYVCPMDPEGRSSKPGPCQKCAMPLEPETPRSVIRTEYTCPMPPDGVQSAPGACPICGMALEPGFVAPAAEGPSPELRDMTPRFWVSLAISVPLIFLAMAN